MDNYVKGKNVEREEILHEDIISNLPPILASLIESDNNANTIYDRLREKMCWMQMRGGSKLRNFINPCINSLSSSGFVIISGSGPAVSKVVSCTEIVKRKFKSPKPLYQLTKISYRTVDEHWDPKTEDLDPIKVTREIPQIDILLRAMIFNDCANMSSSFDAKNSTLDVFLNVNSVKNSTKKKKFKSKTGKRTGTSATGKLDAARELGLIDTSHGHGGVKRTNSSVLSQTKNRSKDSHRDSNNCNKLT